MHSRMLPALLTLLIICSILTAFYFQIPGQAQPIISIPERGEISYGSISSGYAPWTPKEDCVPAFIDLANKYGGTYESIGKSSSPNNWDIIMFKFGNPNGAPIMIDAQLHGNEYYGYETLYALATWLLTSNDATARHILQNNYVLIVPVVDYRWARTNYNSPTWMTAYDPSVDGEHCGVNLNRNFDPGWSSSLSRSNSDSYSGTAPNSEKESQALINAWNTYHPRIYWNLHQGAGPMTMCSATTSQATADANKVRSILPSIQSSLGVSRGWSFSVRGNGNSGMAIDAAAKAGIAGLLTEVMSGWDSSSTKRTDLTSGNTFKQVKAMFIAMCQAVESTTTPAPTPTPNPTPSPSSTPTPAPSPTPTSTPNARLTVSIGAGNGTTTPSEGTHTYNQGQEVTITAFPASTHFFSRWIIDGESFWREPTINVTMNSDHDAEALFYRPQLTMVPSPNGTTSPSGDTIYNANTQVTLTATPNNGYRFDYWIIDYDWIIDYETYETSNPFKLTMIDSVQVTPVFTSNDESPPQLPSPTPTPTPTPTPSPTPAPTPPPTTEPTPTPTTTLTPSPTQSPSPSPTPTPTSNSTLTPSPSALPNPTPSPTSTPNASSTPSPSLSQSTAQSGVLLEDDFGPKSSGDWDEKVVSSGETITTFTDRKSHDESYVRFTTDGQFTQNEYAYFAKNIDLEEAYARGEFLLISTTSSQLLKNDGDTIYLMQFTNEDGSRVLAGVKREAGINKWILSADGFSKTASGVSSDKWYTIELHYNAFQGTVQMSVDGQETLQINIYSTNQKIKQFDFGIVSATESKDQFIIYADYVKLSTTYTTLEGNTQDTIWTTLLPIISVVSIAIFLAYYRDPIFKIGNNFITNRRKTILIVDNDKTILKTIASFLQENGYTTDTAETGNQAIQKMQTKDYDVGIFSTTLPDISGIELLPKIPRKTTPMYKIVITSVSTKEIGSLAADNGADEYLVKPINPKELIKLIKNHFY